MSGPHGYGYTPQDAFNILPIARKRIRDEDLTAAAATQAIAFAAALPNNVLKLYGYADIDEAWSLDETDATGLNAQLGDSGDPNGILTALELIGVSAGLTALGGAGAEYGDGLVVPHASYTPSVLFTATGGATPLVNEADAGDMVFCVPFICVPADLYAYTPTIPG